MAAILVIDDDPMAREIITEMLSQGQHQTVETCDGLMKTPTNPFAKDDLLKAVNQLLEI
jgi:CheY-like chemotaxis protein